MKQLKQNLALAIGALFFTMAVYAQNKNVALVSFQCNKKIGIANPTANMAVQSLADDPNFNLKPILEKAYKRFVEEFAKDFPFKLLDKSTIVNNEQYKKYESKFLWDTTSAVNKSLGVQYVIIDGMVFGYACTPCLVKEEKRDECNMAKIFDTADGIMFVSLDYEFQSKAMGFAAGINAYINIALYDKKCGKVFKIRESAISKGTVGATMGIPIMKPEKIQPLCEDATNELFEDLKGRIGKIVKKSSKL